MYQKSARRAFFAFQPIKSILNANVLNNDVTSKKIYLQQIFDKNPLSAHVKKSYVLIRRRPPAFKARKGNGLSTGKDCKQIDGRTSRCTNITCHSALSVKGPSILIQRALASYQWKASTSLSSLFAPVGRHALKFKQLL